MNQNNTYLKTKEGIFTLGILFISAILPAFLAIKHILISPDSMMYALVSQEIISGNGISLPMVYDLRDEHVLVNGTIPFVLDPPLFPILLALLGGVTSHNFLAAQMLNVISHVSISLFTFLIMKNFYDNNSIALLTGVLVSFSYPLLWNTHHMLTESLFIALILSAIYFLILSRDPVRCHFNRNLFIASLCTSFAILTKFAGVALMPMFFWGIFISVKNKITRLNTGFTLVSAILPLFTVAGLFTTAYVISGSLHGWIYPSPDRSYLSAITGTLKMILLQFQFGEHHIPLIAIIITLIILFFILNVRTREAFAKYVHSGLDLIIVFMISHTALISYSMAKSQTIFELRYMSPLVPFIFILCALLFSIVWKLIRHERFSMLSFCGIVIFLGIIIFSNIYKTYVNSTALFSKEMGHYRILDSPTYKWIKENYRENVIITSNRPYHLSFFGRYSTIRLPHKRFEKNSWLPDNMALYLPNRMSKFGSEVLVLFEKADEQYEGSYIAALFRKGENDDNFILIKKFPDGVIYKLKE